jgi:hypothetical protein
VGGGGASRALDWGWEAVEAAVNGKQELRRRSGEVESLGKRLVSKMGACKCKSKFTRSSRTCSGSRRRHGRESRSWRARRHAWRLGRRRRDMERQGRVQRGVGSGGTGAGEARGVAEPPELFRLKCASHRYTGDPNSTHFKRNNPLVCRVTARYHHGSTGLKQIYLARR